MEIKEFCLLIDEICELEEGEITGGESLEDTELFNSLAMLGLIAMLDEKFSMETTTQEIGSFGTVEGLYNSLTK